MSPSERRPTLTDCGCEATVYADGSGIELHYCPMHQAAKELLEALRPFAGLGLWEDNYPPDSEEYAEAHTSDSRLEVWVQPSQVRAARAAIKATGG